MLGEQYDIEAYKAKFPNNWLKIENDFEKGKMLKKDCRTVLLVEVPERFCKLSTKKKIFNSFHDEDEDRCFIEVSGDQLQELWDVVLQDTTNLLQEMIAAAAEKNTKVDCVYLVGSLSCSKIFQRAIAKMCPSGTKIMFPEVLENVIAEGAIHFGKKVDFVPKRVSRTTYGIEVSRPWDDKYNGKAKMTPHTYSENGWFHTLSESILLTHIRKNNH